MGTGILSWTESGPGVTMTAHYHLIRRLRISEAIPPPPYMPS